MNKVVIFDIGGVIHSAEGIMPYESIAQGFNISVDDIKTHGKSLLKKLDMGLITEEIFWHDLAQILNKPIPNESHELLVGNLRENGKVFDSMIKFIDKLKTNGIKVVALSNVSFPHAEIVKEMNIYNHFDKLFLSHELGLSKPEPEIFNHVLNDLEVEAKECIYVDDIEENLSSPKKLGFETVLAINPEQVIKEIESLLKL